MLLRLYVLNFRPIHYCTFLLFDGKGKKREEKCMQWDLAFRAHSLLRMDLDIDDYSYVAKFIMLINNEYLSFM